MSTLVGSMTIDHSTVPTNSFTPSSNRDPEGRATAPRGMSRSGFSLGALLVASAVSLVACDSPADESAGLPAGDPEATIEQLDALNDRFNEFTATYDQEGFLSLYSEQTLWISPDAPPLEGLEAPRATFEFLADNEGTLTHTADHFFVSDDGTQAVMIGRADIVVENAELDAAGTYLFVLERADGGWTVVADMFHQFAEQ